MVRETILIPIPVKCSLGFETPKFIILLHNPFRIKDAHIADTIHRRGGIELVQTGPLPMPFMRSFRPIHPVSQTHQIILGCAVHISHHYYLCLGLKGKDRIHRQLQGLFRYLPLPFRLSSTSTLTGQMADKKMDSIAFIHPRRDIEYIARCLISAKIGRFLMSSLRN